MLLVIENSDSCISCSWGRGFVWALHRFFILNTLGISEQVSGCVFFLLFILQFYVLPDLGHGNCKEGQPTCPHQPLQLCLHCYGQTSQSYYSGGELNGWEVRGASNGLLSGPGERGGAPCWMLIEPSICGSHFPHPYFCFQQWFACQQLHSTNKPFPLPWGEGDWEERAEETHTSLEKGDCVRLS